MATNWNVVSTVADAPSKWNVQSVVREPQAGDLHLGGDAPEGFHAVTGDDGKQTLRSNLGVGDITQMLGDLPGVGLATNMGAGALNLGKKAVSGIAGIFGADPKAVQGEPMVAPPSNDPLLGAMNAIGEGAQNISKPVDEMVGNLPDGPRTIVQGLEEAIPDIAAVAGARVPLKGVGPTVGEAAQSVKSLAQAPGKAFDAAAGVGEQWFKAGLRTGGGHTIARQVAGESGREALIGHNAELGNAVSAAEAGHAPDAPMSYESLAKAREAPSTVYNRVARGLPDGGLDDISRKAVENAGSPEGGRMTKGSPQAQQVITDLKAQMLDPNRTFTGQQMVNELRGLRQEGFVNAASDDVSNQQLGKAQLDVARALEDHISRNLPKGGDVTIEQFKAARKELAKNWSVQASLRGSDVDLRAIGRVYRADPELLDGGLKMLGEFAEGPGKGVVGVPERYNPPGTLKDMAGIANIHRPVQSTLEGIPGVGASARRFLTGNTSKAIENAQRMFPQRAPGAFDPIAGLRPPPGRVGRPGPVPPEQLGLGDLLQGEGRAPWMSLDQGANPNAARQAPMGDFASVLSDGLEQSPPPGLSVGPMGTPQGDGLPFQMSPELVGAKPRQGGAPKPAARVTDDYGNSVDPEPQPHSRVPLGDRFAGGAGQEKLGDVAAVQMQGVPEDIAQRTPPKAKVQHEADEDTGEHTVTSANGSTRAQESGPYLLVKRSDTKKAAQGNGEGLARMEALVQQAEHRGLALGSDVSVSPAQQKVYAALKRKGYDVVENDSTTNPDTGNLVSADPRKPVFEVRSKLAMAVGE